MSDRMRRLGSLSESGGSRLSDRSIGDVLGTYVDSSVYHVGAENFFDETSKPSVFEFVGAWIAVASQGRPVLVSDVYSHLEGQYSNKEIRKALRDLERRGFIDRVAGRRAVLPCERAVSRWEDGEVWEG